MLSGVEEPLLDDFAVTGISLLYCDRGAIYGHVHMIVPGSGRIARWLALGALPTRLPAAGASAPLGAYASVAVVGSIIRRTSVILFAGKPLRLACS